MIYSIDCCPHKQACETCLMLAQNGCVLDSVLSRDIPNQVLIAEIFKKECNG
jgi:hypothetical protein